MAIQKPNPLALKNAIKTIVNSLSDSKNVNSTEIMFQQTTNNGIRTVNTKFFSNGARISSDVFIPCFEKASEGRPMMLELQKMGYLQKEIARLFHVSQSTVSRVLNDK